MNRILVDENYPNLWFNQILVKTTTMKSDDIRKAFFEFMTDSVRNHIEIPNISLIPVNDPTILFTNSGMFPLVPYLSGEPHPKGKRLCNFQRSFRSAAKDIAEIGDNRHTSMFEMMGNWSLGDYFKEKQIPWVFELYTKHFGLDPERLYVSVWGGDDVVGRDDVSIDLWKEVFKAHGIDAEFTEDITNIPADLESAKSHKYRIFPYGKSDNWWQRGEAPGELGGPSSEIFYDLGQIAVEQDEYHINDDSGRFIEIGNSVFMEYKLDENMNWQKLSQKNVDFGGGFERVVMCSQGKTDIFETDLYVPIIEKIEKLSGKSYKDKGNENEFTSSMRILADHARASSFIIADGIVPANKDQGYILRSLIRRMIRTSRKLEMDGNFTRELAVAVIERMHSHYPQLKQNESSILNELEKEELKFAKTLDKGLKELQKYTGMGLRISGKDAFYIYETYGFPIEMIIEELAANSANDPGDYNEKEIEEILNGFNTELENHKAQSRAGAERKFKGGLADQSERTTALHTTHHLLLAALQNTLGKHVKQRGSNITSERLRIDFLHNEKLTPEILHEVENLVNEYIAKDLIIEKVTMPKSEAEKIGAEMEFGKNYGDLVTVYFIKDQQTDEEISKEFCGGPHVEKIEQIREQGSFKILKEESSGAGIRRIKATLSNE